MTGTGMIQPEMRRTEDVYDRNVPLSDRLFHHVHRSLLTMPRERTPPRSRQLLEGYSRDQLISYITSLAADSYLENSWRLILSKHLEASLPGHSFDLPTYLQCFSNELLIDCVMALGLDLEITMSRVPCKTVQPTGLKNVKHSKRGCLCARKGGRLEVSELKQARLKARQMATEQKQTITDVSAQLAAAKRTIADQQSELTALYMQIDEINKKAEDHERQLSVAQNDLHRTTATQERVETELSMVRRRQEKQEITLGQMRAELEAATDAAEDHQSLPSATRTELSQKEEALDAASENFRFHQAQRAELEMELFRATSEEKRTQQRLTEAQGTISTQQQMIAELKNQSLWTFADLDNNLNEDSNRYRVPGHLDQSCLTSQMAIEELTLASPEIDQGYQFGPCPQSQIGITGTFGVSEFGGASVMAELCAPQECYEQMPVALTNDGCGRRVDHCEEFILMPVPEMGNNW